MESSFRLCRRLVPDYQEPVPRTVTSVAVVTVLDLFLEWCQKNRAGRTYDWYRDYLQSFVKTIPGLTVAALRPFHVQQWVDKHPGWVTGKRGRSSACSGRSTWRSSRAH